MKNLGGRPSRISEIAAERNITEEELLTDALAKGEGSLARAAMYLGVYPNTIRVALDRLGLTVTKVVSVKLRKSNNGHPI